MGLHSSCLNSCLNSPRRFAMRRRGILRRRGRRAFRPRQTSRGAARLARSEPGQIWIQYRTGRPRLWRCLPGGDGAGRRRRRHGHRRGISHAESVPGQCNRWGRHFVEPRAREVLGERGRKAGPAALDARRSRGRLPWGSSRRARRERQRHRIGRRKMFGRNALRPCRPEAAERLNASDKLVVAICLGGPCFSRRSRNPDEDHDAGELREGVEVAGVAFVASHEPPEAQHPGEEPFDVPTPAIAAYPSGVPSLERASGGLTLGPRISRGMRARGQATVVFCEISAQSFG